MYFPVHLFPCLSRRIRRNAENDVRDLELRRTEFHFCPQSKKRPAQPRSVGHTISSLGGHGKEKTDICEAARREQPRWRHRLSQHMKAEVR